MHFLFDDFMLHFDYVDIYFVPRQFKNSFEILSSLYVIIKILIQLRNSSDLEEFEIRWFI
jgi:hypothetical protein